MRTLEKNYRKSERIVAKARFSNWIFLRESFVAVLLAGIIAALWIFTPQINDLIGQEILTVGILKYVAVGCAGFVFVLFLIEAIVKYFKESIITDRKVVIRVGVLAVENFQIPLDQIKTVHVSQSFFQRIFGYGKVTIIADAESPVTLRGVVQPDKFAQCITRQKARKENDVNRKLMLELTPTSPRR